MAEVVEKPTAIDGAATPAETPTVKNDDATMVDDTVAAQKQKAVKQSKRPQEINGKTIVVF